MARRRGNFFRDFADGYNTTKGVMKDFAMSRAASESPEEMQQYTPDQAEQLHAAANAKDADGNPLYKIEAGEGGNYNVTPTAGGETGTLAPTKQYSMGGMTRVEQFSPAEIGAHRLRKMSETAMRFGSPAEAVQYDALATRQRQAAEDEQIRKAYAGAGSNQGETQPATAGTGPQGMTRAPTSYLEQIRPQVMSTYLKQGKLAEAKAFQDFSESEQGRAYAGTFAQAQRAIAAGDYDGAIPFIQQLHGQFPDGKRAQTEHVGDGQYRVTMIDEATGKPTGQRVMAAADLSRLAINALSPVKLVETTIAAQAKRDAEAASLNKSIQLETLRQQGQDIRDDRRDERLTKQLNAMDGRLNRQLEMRERGGGLTLAQQRSNFEIDAAREMITGLSDDDIRRRTTPTTATGRENPDFDPALARAAKLASRRRLGDDEWFDQRQGRQPSSSFAGKPLNQLTDAQLEQFGRQAGNEGRLKIDSELARRSLAGMPGTEGFSIGQYVEGKGFQVLDASGKPVSYLRRKAQ